MTSQQPTEASGRDKVLTPGSMEVMAVSTAFELQRDREWFKRILSGEPKRDLPLAGGKVCQSCGKLGFFEGPDEHSAAHWECGGDFLAFAAGHEACAWSPYTAQTRHRTWRYCEACRTPVEASPQTRCGHFWLCFNCEAEITSAEHKPGAVLADLAFRRQAIRGLLALKRRAQPDQRRSLDLNLMRRRAVAPLDGVLPLGLELCDGCGQIRGTSPRPSGGRIEQVNSVCFCEGLVCKSCGRRRVRRPISDYFSPVFGHWWHVPYFVGFLSLCAPCNQMRNEELRERGGSEDAG